MTIFLCFISAMIIMDYCIVCNQTAYDCTEDDRQQELFLQKRTSRRDLKRMKKP